MQKKTLVIVTVIAVLGLFAACKKNSSPAPAPGNVPHALTDNFYWRAKLDTQWTYLGDPNKTECVSATGVCASFFKSATFTLNDSANPYPHDSIIMSWLGKTFVTSHDSISHPYTFSFKYPDTLSRMMSSDFTSNFGSSLTIVSITSNGHSTLTTPDSPALYYNMYKIKGTFNANLSLYRDTNIVHLTQGDFSISVMENKHP
ncbi:MAG: hypothetical protein JWO03_1999 [Bacteroidetes bacterium]|nr:hypothetical protein [Bacteroidota bacterium]